jgi:hypothetical protein
LFFTFINSIGYHLPADFLPPFLAAWDLRNFFKVCMFILSVVPTADFLPPTLAGLLPVVDCLPLAAAFLGAKLATFEATLPFLAEALAAALALPLAPALTLATPPAATAFLPPPMEITAVLPSLNLQSSLPATMLSAMFLQERGVS